VRWWCRYEISYRDLEEILEEWGVGVDRTTIYRRVREVALLALAQIIMEHQLAS
jgi:transposase-like protein